jgi:ubiquitin-activating enzyme E1
MRIEICSKHSQVEMGHAPRPVNAADADKLIVIAKQLNEKLPEGERARLDEGVLRKLAHCAGGEICPMTAMFGGVVGQEVMKAMSGKVCVLD